jgi:hypothetical protein
MFPTIRISKFLSIITIAVALISISARPAGAAMEDTENCTRWHTVKSGEYLALIAEQYDTSWRSIAEINRMSNPSMIFPNQKLCIFSSDYTSGAGGSGSSGGIPIAGSSATVYASSVKEDQSVTLQAKNLLANSRYSVYLGKYNAASASNILVGTVTTDKTGTFKKSFDIPKKLFDVMKVGVSITSPTGKTTSNWFINATSNSNTGGINSQKLGIGVQSIRRNQWVKLATTNLPANVTFKVYMNKAGASEKKAVQVGTLKDSKGGSIVATFEIPASLKDRSQLEIIVFNNPLGMRAEAIFYNNTSK